MPHELKTAEALAEAGHVVEFVRRSEEKRAKSADALIDGVLWEMKAPTADNLKAIERNLKRGRWQSGSIVFDCRRMKKHAGHFEKQAKLSRRAEVLAEAIRLGHDSFFGRI